MTVTKTAAQLTRDYNDRVERINAKWTAHPAIQRKLAFGDAEQITALAEWRQELATAGVRENEADGLRWWSITYRAMRTCQASVCARTRDAAIEALHDDEDGEVVDIEAITAGDASDDVDAEGDVETYE